MTLQLNMIVDVDPGLLPLGILVGVSRQGLEGGPIKGLEEGLAGGIQLLEGPVVELGELLGNRLVEFMKAEEAVVSERRQDPVLDHQDGRLHFGRVPGLSGPGGNDDRPVMPGQLVVGGVRSGS